MAAPATRTNDFSLFSSPFDLSASLGSGSSAGSAGDSGSERGETSPLPPTRGPSAAGSVGGKKTPGCVVVPTCKSTAGVPPRAGAPSSGDEHSSLHKHSIPVPIKSHLKPHVNHSRITPRHAPHASPHGNGGHTSPFMRPHSLPMSAGGVWHPPRSGLRHASPSPRCGDALPFPPLSQSQRLVANGEEEYRIMITSPLSSPLPPHRDYPMCGDNDSLINGMSRMSMSMSMHGSIHDEPRVVDISPASGYYEARKPRLRNGGLNARLYNAFRVTTKDHLSINTRSPTVRGVRGVHSFASDMSMSAGNSPYGGPLRAGAAGSPTPLRGGWDTPNGGPPNFSLGGGDRSFNTSYSSSSVTFASPNTSLNRTNSSGPRLGNSHDDAPGTAANRSGGGKSAPGTPQTQALPPMPFSPLFQAGAAPGTPLDSLPPGADIRDVMALHGIHGAAVAADGSLLAPLSPTPPFGIKYKTELCLNWINTGVCVYGNKCHFGHGDTDLRARKRVRNFKTQMCCDPAREGARRCMFNARCNFLHPSEPLRRAEPVPYFDEDYFGMLMRDFPGNDYPFGIYV